MVKIKNTERDLADLTDISSNCHDEWSRLAATEWEHNTPTGTWFSLLDNEDGSFYFIHFVFYHIGLSGTADPELSGASHAAFWLRESPCIISITNTTGTVLHSNNEINSFSVFKIRWTDIHAGSGKAEIESDTEKVMSKQ